MEFKSKFNCGDAVYQIVNHGKKTYIPCDFCNEVGFIQNWNNSESRSCPKCYGRKGEFKYIPGTVWEIFNLNVITNSRLTIGQINIVYRENLYEEHYMCHETGVGSGTLYSGDYLFLTKEAAQAACDKRNKEMEKDQ